MTPAGLYALTTVLDKLGAGATVTRNAAPAASGTPGVAGAGDASKNVSTAAAGRAAVAATVGNAARALPLPAAELPSALPTLSGLAQLVTRIAAGTDGAAALSPVALPTPAADTAELPAAIREAVQQSGLFYESHLEDWVAGRRSLEDVLNEPQARFTQRHLGEVPARDAAALPKAPDAAATPATPDARASDAASSSRSSAADAPRTANAPDAWQPPRALEPIVREQLAVLAQGAASVPLMPWPGQGAMLEIRDEARAPGAPEDAAPAFRVSLKMTLPELGRVEFVLSAQGDAIRVAAAADEAASRDALAARSRELREALAARALTLDAMEIGTHAD